MSNDKKNIPTILIILGATGDLMKKKIVPALFHLFKGGYTPKMFHIIGLSRRDITDAEFSEKLKEILEFHKEKDYESFLKLWTYHQADFENLQEYHSLAKKLGYFDEEWHVCSNKLFYIAAPPQYYEKILTNLHESQLTKPCSPEEGFTRLLIEKPFGKDTKTAERLEELLAKLFKEEQIYRVDHYLAKETLQNILNFRFSNTLFEGSWSNKYIEKVRIRLFETLGVENRGDFYDGLGALRDVGQNHLLQMLALITMDKPKSFSSTDIRQRRIEIFETLIKPDGEEVKNFSYRAQYEDYGSIKGVKDRSQTETYFKIRGFLSHPRWRGVPFILESGKRLGESRKEIIITFRHPTPCSCPTDAPHYKNRVVFQIEPEEGVFVDLWSKKPGLTSGIQGQKFQYLIRNSGKRAQYVEEYEKLILDAINGDQTLFVESSEVKKTWHFIDPYIEAWEKNLVPLKTYKKDTDRPAVDSQFIDDKQSVFVKKTKKQIGIIGLGKMGTSMALQLLGKDWQVVGYQRSLEKMKGLEGDGLIAGSSLKDLVGKLSSPRIILLSLPAGETIDDALFAKDGIASFLTKGDTVIDTGNSFYKDSQRRAQMLEKLGFNFIDVGFSGGPQGARYGGSLMIGGHEKNFKDNEQLFFDLSVEEGYQFFEGSGAGHFVKMVHNGIEYGMMQAIAEGFAVMEKSSFKPDLLRVAEIYNRGSVIESHLIKWLEDAFIIHGQDLKDVTGKVGQLGEGKWTVETAKELKVRAKIIEASLNFRNDSQKNPSYTGKILTALREQFGGHKSK